MLSSIGKFSKSLVLKIFVGIIILPFVFWGMGDIFRGGNQNIVATIDSEKLSTQEFVNYLNRLNLTEKEKNELKNAGLMEKILSEYIGKKIINLEVKDLGIILSDKSLKNIIVNDKAFFKDKKFSRTKYEKFLLENNISAPIFEKRLKDRELQKKLFDFIGAGTVSPQFLVKKLFENENKKLKIDFINLENFYKKKDEIDNQDLIKFIDENADLLKVEYIDFQYSIINPQNLIGLNEFNQEFFDKIDQIENSILNGIKFDAIISEFNLNSKKINDYKFSEKGDEIQKKIYEVRNNNFDIFENKENYVIYKIENVEQKKPDLNDDQIKKEVIELISQKNKFDFNRSLLEKIGNKKFNDNDFLEMGQTQIETIKLNSNRDNNKFEINSVKSLYSLPVNSFTLVNDEQNNIYLVKIKDIQNELINNNNDQLLFKEYRNKQNSNMKNNILKTYDLYLNKKYDVVLNQKTIERVKNFFQ